MATDTQEARNDVGASNISAVEALVKSAFGKRASISYELGLGVRDPHVDTFAKSSSRALGLILIPSRMPLSEGRLVGRFTSSDGSSLDVFPKYAAQAASYSGLYEGAFGKKPNLRFTTT